MTITHSKEQIRALDSSDAAFDAIEDNEGVVEAQECISGKWLQVIADCDQLEWAGTKPDEMAIVPTSKGRLYRVRTPVPCPAACEGYRILEPHEGLQEGDEYYYAHNDSWQVSGNFTQSIEMWYRRKLKVAPMALPKRKQLPINPTPANMGFLAERIDYLQDQLAQTVDLLTLVIEKRITKGDVVAKANQIREGK